MISDYFCLVYSFLRTFLKVNHATCNSIRLQSFDGRDNVQNTIFNYKSSEFDTSSSLIGAGRRKKVCQNYRCFFS